jgi:two-component system, NarL family, nitrate/nitrite response regulator NarL
LLSFEDDSPTRNFPSCKEIALSVDEGTRLGVVLKGMAPQLLVQCVRKVHAGEPWIERHSTNRVLHRLLRHEVGARELTGVLTPRELEIVRLVVARGLPNVTIAKELHISEGTVKIHPHNIYEKLHLDGRLALLLYAQDKRLV